MELELQTYFWLTNQSILKADEAPDVNLQSNKVVLSENQAQGFVSGHYVAKMIQKMQLHGGEKNKINVENLKNGSSMAMHSFNWKYLTGFLEGYSLKMSDEDKVAVIKSFENADFSKLSVIVNKLKIKADEKQQGSANGNRASLSKKKPSKKLSPLRSNSALKLRSLNNISKHSDYDPHQRTFDTNALSQQAMHPHLKNQLGRLHFMEGISPGDQVVDFQRFSADIDTSETSNCLEFLLTSLCRIMDLRPKQAAGLLTNNNKYLAVVVMKGFKGDFRPIINWYQEIYAQTHHATQLIEKEMRNKNNVLASMLNTLRVGFHSRSVEVAEWTSKVFSRFGQEFLEAQIISKAWDWLVDPRKNNPGGPGFLSLIQLIERENSLADSIAQVLLQFGQFNLNELFAHHLLQLAKSPLQYLRVTQVLFPALTSYKIAKDQILSSGLLQFWINFTIQRADNTTIRNTINLRTIAVIFLCDLWITFPQVIEENEDVSNGIHTMLKRGCRDQSRLLKQSTLTQLFRLLDHFTAERNFFAPLIYKTITFSLIQNHHEQGTREYVLRNISHVFDSVPSIPVDVLMSPLMKQVRVSEGISFAFKLFDFDFLTGVARHPKLSIKVAIQTLDVLAKTYIEDIRHSMEALTPMLIMLSRFIDSDSMQEYLKELIKLFMTRLIQLENKQWQPLPPNKHKNLGGGGGPVPIGGNRQNAMIKQHGSTFKSTKPAVEAVKEMFDDNRLRKIRKGLILEFFRKVLLFQKHFINDDLKRQMLMMNLKHKRRYNRDHRGILSLLKNFGDPQTLVMEFEADYLEKMKNEGSVTNTVIQEIEGHEKRMRDFADNASEPRNSNLKYIIPKAIGPHGERLNKDWSLADLKGKTNFEDSINRSAISEMPKLNALRGKRGVLVEEGATGTRMYVPYQKKLNRMERKALLEIEAIKLKKEARIERRKIEEERRLLRIERVKAAANKELEKRRINEGKVVKLDDRKYMTKALNKEEPQNESNVKTELEHLKANSYLAKTVNKRNNIVIIDLKEEPKLEQEKVQRLFRKYQKLLKALMLKYSNTGYQVKRVAHLPSLAEGSKQKLTLAELTKLLKDHYFTNAMVNQDALSQIMRQINGKNLGKSDTTALSTLPTFEDFLLQVSVYVYTKPPKKLLNTSPSFCLKALMEQFEFATRAKGESTILFEEADIGAKGNDKDIIKELNSRLKEDPDTALPPNYQRVKEEEYKPSHQFPPLLKMHPTIKMAVQILDDIFHKKFKFHIMEPLTQVSQVYKAKKVPQLLRQHIRRNSIEGPVNRSHYNDQDRPRNASVFTARQAPPVSKVKTSQVGSLKAKAKLTTNMKLLIAQYPEEERDVVKEVAFTLEDILNSVTSNKTELYGRSYISKVGGKLQNKALQDRARAAQLEKLDKERREQRVIQRRMEIAEELERMREKREEKLKQQQEERQKQMAKEERKKARLADLDNKLRKEYEEKRAKRVAEENVKQERLKDKQIQKQQVLKRQNAIKLKIAQAGIEEELRNLSLMNRAKKHMDKQETKGKKTSAEKQAISNFYNKDKEKIESSKKSGTDFVRFLNSPQVKAVFTNYAKPLKFLFQHYTLENGDASINDTLIRAPGWKKLGMQFNLFPKVVSGQDYIYVFKIVTKKNTGELTQALDENCLQEALVRVATLGRYKIQGIPEPKKMIEQSPPEPVKRREVTPPPPPHNKKSSGFNALMDLGAGQSPAKAAGPSVLFQENQKMIDSQLQFITGFKSGTAAFFPQMKASSDKIKSRKGKGDINELTGILDNMLQTITEFGGSLKQVNEQFINTFNRKSQLTIAKELKSEPESAIKMIDKQSQVEVNLQKTLADLTQGAEHQLELFDKMKGNLIPKKKNAAEQAQLETQHQQVLAKGKKAVEDFRKNSNLSKRRFDQLMKQKEEAKQLGLLLAAKKPSTNALLRKKTEAPVAPKQRSPPTLLGKVPPPLKQTQFGLDHMNARVIEKLLKEHMGLDSGDGKIKMELKIKQKVGESSKAGF